jgi:hypothetical protein
MAELVRLTKLKSSLVKPIIPFFPKWKHHNVPDQPRQRLFESVYCLFNLFIFSAF